MAHRLCLSCWLLACWLVVTVAEGQVGVVIPSRGSQNNVDPTDCQIFTLTPPPPTRKPVTRIQPITRKTKCPFHFFPIRRPSIQVRFPHRPFLPPRCNHRFQYRPYFWPNNRLSPYYNYFPRRRLRRGSSSEERRGKREAPNLLNQRRSMPQKRL